MIEIQIKNWDKFNPRKDVKSASWFRFDNSFFTNPTFFVASSDTKIVWCYLLCCASQKMSGKIKISKEMICALLRISEKSFNDGIAFLISADCIELVGKESISSNINTIEYERESACDNTKMHATNERTNERTNEESKTIEEPIPDRDGVFLVEQKETLKENKPRKKRDNSEAKEKAERIKVFYSRYPRKKDDGDKAAIARLKRLPLSEFDDLDKALDNYLFHISLSETDPKYYLGLYGFIDAKNSWLCRSDLPRMKSALALYKQQAEC